MSRFVFKIVAGVIMLSPLFFPFPAKAISRSPELPVTRVSLFSSGVGSFEHTGTVSGDAKVTLFFTPDQINDVIKSMVINDLDGGAVSDVVFPSRDPLNRTLKSFAVDLSENPDMSGLLNQLKGAVIEIETTESLSGKILNVETQTKEVVVSGNTVFTHVSYLNLVSEDGMRSIPLNSIGRIRFMDPDLDLELQKALSALGGAMDKNRKPVTISFSGAGERRVRIRYILETPVWKTAYRLSLPDSISTDEKAVLQGWAVLENSSDTDWEKIRLDLLSGRPISFIQDLYRPLYIKRPVVESKTDGFPPPRVHAGGVKLKSARGKMMPEKTMAAPAAMSQAYDAQAAGAAPEKWALEKGVEAAASAEAAGELFRFSIKSPVSLSRRQGAMLPIVQQPVSVTKVSIYHQSAMTKYPLNGIRLINDTGVKLPKGPVTVFDGGVYAGDARLGDLVTEEERFISYALDLTVTVDPSTKQDNRVTAVKIVGGVLEEIGKSIITQTYGIHNKSGESKELIVEHAVHPGYDLVKPAESPDKQVEKAPGIYRFSVRLAPEQNEDLVVQEERIHHRRLALLEMRTSELAHYIKTGDFSEAGKDALQKLTRMKQAIRRRENERQRLAEDEEHIAQDQQRIRKNLSSSGKETPLGKRYLAKLNAQEDELEKIGGEKTTLQKEIVEKRNEMAGYLKNLDIQ